MKQNRYLRDNLTFGFEQTFTITEWWTDEGFTSTSDTPLKRDKMKSFALELSKVLDGKYFESKDIWDHMQYEVTDKSGDTQFYVTMDPGSIEVKTPPCLVHKTQKMAAPMFEAAEKSGLVAYRNWWYGVKAGTEGGCHVNMGGHSEDSNPLKQNPELVVKYCAYIHNRPWLHYPFMGLDVGPEGNAMRMDEKEGFDIVQKRFSSYITNLKSENTLSPQETYDYFKDTNLIKEKGSFPSMYKFKTGLFLIEDRGQESLREEEDFYLVSELRMQILEHLIEQGTPEELKSFPDLHKKDLTLLSLWDNFFEWSKDFSIPVQKYARFFERQFPKLNGGTNVPNKIIIRDGRRPRKIKDIQKRGDVVISKTVDTSYKRFEVFTSVLESEIRIKVEGIEFESKSFEQNFITEKLKYKYLDIKIPKDKPVLKVEIILNDNVIDSGTFNMNDMMWV